MKASSETSSSSSRRPQTPAIRTLYRFTNGMICALDKDGEQIPKHNGRFEKVKRRLNRTCGTGVEYHVMDWATKHDQIVVREEFFADLVFISAAAVTAKGVEVDNSVIRRGTDQ